jgi:myo-inositol-1(or 4)-monophosphatase
VEINLESLIKDLAIKAGSFIRSRTEDLDYRQIMRRGATDVSRRIDLEVEDLIIRGVENERLNAVIETEERGIVRVGDDEPEYHFVVDPLDGSLNFVLGIPFYSVSIAVGRHSNTLRFNDLSDGVVYYISRDSLYYGGPRGFEARGDDLGDLSSDIDRPVVSMYVEPDSDEKIMIGLREAYNKFGRFKIRALGSASLEMVMASMGRFLAFLDLRGRLRIFDVAGAYVISRALGAHAHVLGGQMFGDEVMSVDRRYSIIVSKSEDVAREFSKLING